MAKKFMKLFSLLTTIAVVIGCSLFISKVQAMDPLDGGPRVVTGADGKSRIQESMERYEGVEDADIAAEAASERRYYGDASIVADITAMVKKAILDERDRAAAVRGRDPRTSGLTEFSNAMEQAAIRRGRRGGLFGPSEDSSSVASASRTVVTPGSVDDDLDKVLPPNTEVLLMYVEVLESDPSKLVSVLPDNTVAVINRADIPLPGGLVAKIEEINRILLGGAAGVNISVSKARNLRSWLRMKLNLILTPVLIAGRPVYEMPMTKDEAIPVVIPDVPVGEPVIMPVAPSTAASVTSKRRRTRSGRRSTRRGRKGRVSQTSRRRRSN